MKIHYNNGEKEKIIDNILSIMVVDSKSPVVVCLDNGKELTVSLDNIEMILDEKVFVKGITDTPKCKNCLYKEICKTYDSFGIDTPYNDESTCELFKNKAQFVEVVRCKDCVHKVDYNGRTMCSKFATKSGDHWCGLEAKDDEHFCSHGKRKEVDNNV